VAGKIAKSGRAGIDLALEPTPDVLSGLAARRSDSQTLVGFAAEHGEQALDSARRKLALKRLDAIVVNDISQDGVGFDSDENEVTILLAPDGGPGSAEANSVRVPRASKAQVAEAILDAVEHLRAAGVDGRGKAARARG
jgi:phosphopantothenoylcysteine decarboxylase/phosphopantothenate--cysteine ligase